MVFRMQSSRLPRLASGPPFPQLPQALHIVDRHTGLWRIEEVRRNFPFRIELAYGGDDVVPVKRFGPCHDSSALRLWVQESRRMKAGSVIDMGVRCLH
jgi:hypothetical protein